MVISKYCAVILTVIHLNESHCFYSLSPSTPNWCTHSPLQPDCGRFKAVWSHTTASGAPQNSRISLIFTELVVFCIFLINPCSFCNTNCKESITFNLYISIPLSGCFSLFPWQLWAQTSLSSLGWQCTVFSSSVLCRSPLRQPGAPKQGHVVPTNACTSIRSTQHLYFQWHYNSGGHCVTHGCSLAASRGLLHWDTGVLAAFITMFKAGPVQDVEHLNPLVSISRVVFWF